MNLERAIEIAVTAHKGQKEKSGAPYILHPLRVMLSVESEEERIVGVLHDVVEDTPWTFDQLRDEGFSEAILAALDTVTIRENEDYSTFISRSADNVIGRRVKIADLRDNMDLSRIPQPTEKDHKRMEKYTKAMAQLNA
jgi:(p)ppGpp synthase/HD superfamily hydrolase|tara:strand:+ start:791 stop:1207 length:417 start_codon:yes stop_codon:yes gene_type:complete